MPRIKVRTGVVSVMRFMNRQIVLARKAIAEYKIQIAKLKRADKRVKRLRSATKKIVRRRPTKKSAPAKTTRPKLKSADLAFQIMSERKKPIAIIRLAELVGARSQRRRGENFKQNLGAALARDERFVRVSRGVYGLK